MFHLASINSIGLLIRSKVLSTKGGVTGVSKSYVCQVRLGDFTMPAIHGGMEHRDLGEEKKKSSYSTPFSGLCEKDAIIPGLLWTRKVIANVTWIQSPSGSWLFFFSLNSHRCHQVCDALEPWSAWHSHTYALRKHRSLLLHSLTAVLSSPDDLAVSLHFLSLRLGILFPKEPSPITLLPSKSRNATSQCFQNLLCMTLSMSVNTLCYNY